jgi:hypothetical protein
MGPLAGTTVIETAALGPAPDTGGTTYMMTLLASARQMGRVAEVGEHTDDILNAPLKTKR